MQVKRQLRIIDLSDDTTAFWAESSYARLAVGEVHIWLMRVSECLFSDRELEVTLSPEERDQRDRFYFHADRMRYAVAHGVLRKLIGHYSGIHPEAVRFEREPHGKPTISGQTDNASLTFNLSHSQDLVAVAFSCERFLGVDVEYIRSIPDMEQLIQYFHPAERELVFRLPKTMLEQAFFDCWTRKEAFVKATGEGLSRPLDSFCILEQEGIFTVSGEEIRSGDWEIVGFTPAKGYAGTVVIGVG